MGATPKPRGQRVRRNKGQAEWKELPAEGNKRDAPDLPGEEWLNSTTAWWNRIWKSPMATIWVEADIDPLLRLARLKDDFDRGDRGALGAIQKLEDQFGLSPKARRALQWEIKQAEVVEIGSRRSERKLRAVEG